MTTSSRISLRDAGLLAQLEQSFALHAGADDFIDAAELQRALGMRSEYLAGRVLAGFDTDGDGRVDRDEFLRGVHQLMYGSERDKLMFAFKLHDGDADGFIGRTDLLRMIFLGLAEDQIVTDEAEPERLAAALWAHADTDRDGRISFEEFVVALKRRPTLLASMTRSEAVWISPNEALLERFGVARRSIRQRLSRLVQNQSRELVVVALVLLANAALFGMALRVLPFVPTEELSIRLARAFGRCISLDVGLTFLPVMRHLVTRVRISWLQRFLPVDRAIDLHRMLGHALLGLALLHAAAAVLARVRGHGGAASYLASSMRGLSGSALLLLLATMWLCALPFIRRSKRFELFYFTHLGYIGFVALLVAHAPAFLLWAGLPLGAFLVERLWRRRMRSARVEILKLEALPSGVTRVELERPVGFVQRAGDYAFLNLPALAAHEWHPFTISSAPERENLVFHVRSVGNFSAALREWAQHPQEGASGVAQLDGPYGTPSASIFEARFVVLIGAGIGVTPFASVLESIVSRAHRDSEPSALEKVHFFWLNRDQYSFEWFAVLLSQLEATDRDKLLDIHICMTGGRAGSAAAGLELARRAHHAQGARDVVTGLSALTRMGHPDWEHELAEIAAQHAPAAVDVYFCGPLGLAKKLSGICERHRMRFHEERF